MVSPLTAWSSMTDTFADCSKKLDDLGIADNTIVMYSTDNGAECFPWPDGGTTPFRDEKNSNWEGGTASRAYFAGRVSSSPATKINDITSL